MGTPVTWEAKWQSPLADYLAEAWFTSELKHLYN